MIIVAGQIFQGSDGIWMTSVACAAAVCMTAAMNDIVVPSVSLEGKNIWLIQSLPVKTRDILNAKLAVQHILIV